VRYPSVVWMLAVAFFVLLRPSSGYADEYDRFTHARNAFEAGEYQTAVQRFEELLIVGVKNPALVLEIHKIAAVSYLFVGDKKSAEQHFIRLLTLAPEWDLDPLAFPIEVIDFFGEIRADNKDRILALSRARADEAARAREAEEVERLAELEKLKRNVYLERNRKQNSRLVALVPFGAGQFQNGHMVKGGLFLGSELLLGAASITTYFLHESLRDRASTPFSSSEDREEYERLEAGYRIANQASVVGLAAVAVIGVVDALYNYKSEIITWKNVDEKEVPDELRPGPKKIETSLAPNFGKGMMGLEVRGRF
jgi:tetratricopeptide (TPR) repeat protein